MILPLDLNNYEFLILILDNFSHFPLRAFLIFKFPINA